MKFYEVSADNPEIGRFEIQPILGTREFLISFGNVFSSFDDEHDWITVLFFI